MASAVELPTELCSLPMPFVVLTGLDITYNAVHRSIWDAFSNNRRRDRLQISFACLPGDHQYPQSKAKRTSYDWYIPKGLLKTGWMKKHLSQVPSVVVVFFELDWDDLAWRERHLACASRVQVVRTSLHGRTTKVAVVLIQKSSPLPPGEDMIAAERAAALCSACDLSAKSLFVLPHTDHLIGYIIRLENAFYELAQTYYHTECRRVKAHKEFLNKTTHQLLFPRHQFKVAFFSEMMQDTSTALKHYHQSYNHIHELRLHDTNNLELKVVGGFVNYKICRLCFLKLNAPLDAISQFQRHIELFKPLCGNNELLFEHSAWLSKQFLIFGDLFNEAIVSEGLTAVQTQHPGFYYQRAAHYAQIRKRLAYAICSAVKDAAYPQNDPLFVENLEYFGQRPWRQGHQRIDLSDTAQEKEGILALKLKEANIDHSWQIIPLLSSAVSQFKKFHCPRLKRYLTIEMGQEYYLARDYNKAITLLKRATFDYRDGRWCMILTHLLTLLVDCAYMIADVQSYFTFSSELLGRYSQLPSSQKTMMQENLLRIVGGSAPHRMPIDRLNALKPYNTDGSKVLDSWKHVLYNPASPCVVEVDHLKPFVECKIFFTRPQFPMESCVKLFVCVMVTCPFPVQFSELSVSFSNQKYGQSCVVTDRSEINTSAQQSATGDGPLYYQPWKYKAHEFEFPIDAEDVLKIVEVHHVSLKIACQGSPKGVPLLFNWPITSDNHRLEPEEPLFISEDPSMDSWDNLTIRTLTHISERESRLEVDVVHKAPALVGEIYPLHVCIQSNENEGTVAEDVSVVVSLKPGSNPDDSLFQNTAVSTDAFALDQCTSKTAELFFGNLAAGEKCEKIVYMRASTIGVLNFTFQTSYHVQNVAVLSSNDEKLKTITCSSSANSEVSFDILTPFNFTTHVTSLNFESTSSVNVNEPFLALTTLNLGSQWPIKILSGLASLPSDGGFRLVGESDDLAMVLSEGESVTDCINIVCQNEAATNGNLGIGYYTVCWEREGQTDKVPSVSTTMKLPLVTVKRPALRVSASVPAFGILRKAIQITYSIENKTNESRYLDITYGTADAFMFSGPKQMSNFLPPTSSHTITFNVIPLALGYQALPQFRIMMSQSYDSDDGSSSKKSEEFDVSSLPSHLTVKPADYILAK